MTYTIWSKGRLVGETELDDVRCIDRHRTGDFHPTEVGETLIPVFTEPRVATMDLGRVVIDTTTPETDTDPIVAAAQTRLSAAVDRLEALALELRSPKGNVIPTAWIDICDTENAIALEPTFERPPARYQIHVSLFDNWAVP